MFLITDVVVDTTLGPSLLGAFVELDPRLDPSQEILLVH